jgi:transposase InsO family protein
MTDEHRRIQELEAQVKQLKGDNDRFKRNLNQSVLFHSDQGGQYTSDAYQECMTAHNVISSLS